MEPNADTGALRVHNAALEAEIRMLWPMLKTCGRETVLVVAVAGEGVVETARDSVDYGSKERGHGDHH